MKSIKGLSFYNSEGSLIDVEELYARVQQLEQDGAAKIIIGETASTTSTTSSDIDELAGTETDISLTNADDFKAGDMGVSIVTVTDRNNSHGFMVFLALADEPDQPTGTLHVRFITGIYNGKDGTDGQDATIAIGTVSTGAAGSQASVTNSGTENAAVLDFTIPKGADGASGVTDVTAGTPTEQNGYTVTPVTFNFEQGNSKTVNIQAKNGEGAGVQQNAVINRTASVSTADENSPDFVENNGDLWVKKITGYGGAETQVLSGLVPNGGYCTAATALDGRIYVFGGSRSVGSGTETLDTIMVFDPTTQSLTTLDSGLPGTRMGSPAATAPNGKIYLFGGLRQTYSSSGQSTRNTRLRDIVEFNPDTLRATTLGATLPSARNGATAALAENGKIYVFGGHNGDTALGDIVEFDPETQTVTKLMATLPNARTASNPAATGSNGKIYVFNLASNSLTDIVEFDPVTQNVTTIGTTISSVKSVKDAARALNGKIYIFGQETAGTLNVAEFDPTTQATIPIPEAAISGQFSNITSLCVATALNGKIYGFSVALNTVEFTPPVPQYAYSPAVVLSQEEYAQFKNILNGVFSVGISAPSAAVSGTLEAGNTIINGTLTATGDISAQNVTANGAVTADSAEINGAVSANSAEISGVLSAGNTRVNGTLTATGKITAPSATVNGDLTANSAEVNGTLSAGNTTVNGTLSANGAVTVDGEISASSFNATT